MIIIGVLTAEVTGCWKMIRLGCRGGACIRLLRRSRMPGILLRYTVKGRGRIREGKARITFVKMTKWEVNKRIQCSRCFQLPFKLKSQQQLMTFLFQTSLWFFFFHFKGNADWIYLILAEILWRRLSKFWREIKE